MADNEFNPQPQGDIVYAPMRPGFAPQNETATIAAADCPCDVAPLTATGVDSTHVRVTFAEAVIDNAAIRCIDVWEIVSPDLDHPITVLAVLPEQDPVESVLLTTTEHQTLPSYIARLHFLERAA